MIREATEADVPQLVEMGLHFLRLHYADKLKENPEQIAKTLRDLLANPQGKVLVGGNGHIQGVVGFVVYPQLFSGEPVAGELFWYVEPEARGRLGLELLREAERTAVKMGAETMQMVSPSETTSKLYEKLGYEYVDAQYMRRL